MAYSFQFGGLPTRLPIFFNNMNKFEDKRLGAKVVFICAINFS